jgi:hypothetical protein
MKYTVVVHFKDTTKPDQTFNVDYYTHANGILELFNYNGNETLIKIFSLLDLSSADITQIGA